MQVVVFKIYINGIKNNKSGIIFRKGVLEMKLWIKPALCGILMFGAAASAWTAVGSISKRTAPTQAYAYEWSVSPAEAQYFLREYDGHVGVFSPHSSHMPVTVTDIEVAGLRDADRAMLSSGIAVADQDELLSLLEDFGS